MSHAPLLDRSLRSLLGGAVRGKCRYGPSHESCTETMDGWWGENGSSYECALAPEEQCTVCTGAGEVEVRERNAEGEVVVTRKPCLPCFGRGLVPGPHWPWRHPQPRPLPPRRRW